MGSDLCMNPIRVEPKPLWQQVEDVCHEVDKLQEEIRNLQDKIDHLIQENETLREAIKIVRRK